ATLYSENMSWCYVWCPRDELDASYAMLGGSLHLSVALSPSRTTVHDRVSLALWRELDHLRGPCPFLAEVPQRSWLQALCNEGGSMSPQGHSRRFRPRRSAPARPQLPDNEHRAANW